MNQKPRVSEGINGFEMSSTKGFIKPSYYEVSVSDEPTQFEKDMAMTADELIEDFALGVMRVCDDNLRMYREALGDDYPEGDHIELDVLHQSCHELFFSLSTKEDAMEAVERWVDHERWCVRALAQGAKHLLEHGSFNYGPTTGEEYDEDADLDDDDFDEFCSFAGNVN